MFLYSTEMNIEFMEMLQKGSKRGTLRHFSKGVYILREALTTITKLTIGTRYVSVGVVDISRKKHTRVNFTPVTTHLLTILATSIKVSHLICSKHIMHILGKLSFQWCHNGEFLAHKDLGEQFVSTSKNHSLLLEVFYMSTLSQELRHIMYLMACFLRESVTGPRKNGGTNKHGHVRKICDKLLHECQILRSIILCRNVNLQECNINIAQIIVVSFRGVADEKFALRVVVFQPIFQGSTYEAASDNANGNFLLFHI